MKELKYDSTIPAVLKSTQQWFASIITRPIDIDSQMEPTSPSGNPMEEEAANFITPSPTLRPDKRIQIYNQQYWWRFLSTMHDIFPLVTRLFGYVDFNQSMAIPYLVKYPSTHWSLNNLGDHFPKWIDENYQGGDKTLVYQAACLDWAHNDSFVAAQEPVIDLSLFPHGDISPLLETPLKLQSHVHLFSMPFDLLSFRSEFLAHDPDYWVENEFPILKHSPPNEKLHFILYRNLQNNVIVEKIDRHESQLLAQFKTKGISVDSLCDWLAEQNDAELSAAAAANLQKWLQRWISKTLLACISHNQQQKI